MAGSTAYRLTEPALADSLSRACYRGVTNLRRVYRLDLDLLDLDQLDLDQPDLPGRTYRVPAGAGAPSGPRRLRPRAPPPAPGLVRAGQAGRPRRTGWRPD